MLLIIQYTLEKRKMDIADLSIIVPVYNVEKYLPECINSLINQTFKNIEIILVDDGSTDSSGEICDQYAETDERIKVIHKKNEGQHIARMIALKTINSKYVMFCDSDDFIHFQTVEIMLNLINSANVEYVGCDYIMLYKNTIIHQDQLHNIKSVIVTADDMKIPSNLWAGVFLTERLLSVFLKVPVLRTVGEDAIVVWGYFNEISKSNIIIVKEKLYFYRQRKSSAVHSRGGNALLLSNDLLTLASFRKKSDQKEWDPSLISGLIFCNKKQRKELLKKAMCLMGPVSEKQYSVKSVHYWKFLLFRLKCYKLLRLLYYIKDKRTRSCRFLYD